MGKSKQRTGLIKPQVEVFSWNPKRRVLPSRLGRLLPFRRRVNNFGDLLGPLIVERLLLKSGLDPLSPARSARLLTVGSVLHHARTGDIIWGSGMNGKVDPARHTFVNLDVRAVRGPLTRDYLLERGLYVPEVYGDPALLAPLLMKDLTSWSHETKYDVTVVPNLNDLDHYQDTPHVLDPTAPLRRCLRRIARSRLVVGSSLHALVIADALGIPARGIRSQSEDTFKYHDYYKGTGRSGVLADSVAEAMDMGGAPPIETWSSDRLIDAFPFELWN